MSADNLVLFWTIFFTLYAFTALGILVVVVLSQRNAMLFQDEHVSFTRNSFGYVIKVTMFEILFDKYGSLTRVLQLKERSDDPDWKGCDEDYFEHDITPTVYAKCMSFLPTLRINPVNFWRRHKPLRSSALPDELANLVGDYTSDLCSILKHRA